MAKQLPIEIFTPPNVLKAKVGGSRGDIDTAALLRAEAAMQALKSQFSDWVAADVQRLVECRDHFAARPDQAAREELFRVALDLKGQAATFEYPMISQMAASLAKLLDGQKPAERVALGLIDAHVAAIRAIFRDEIRTTSDRMSIVIAEELEARVAEAFDETV